MSKEEFVEKAKEFGYTDEEIKDLIDMVNECPFMSYETVTLIQRRYN